MDSNTNPWQAESSHDNPWSTDTQSASSNTNSNPYQQSSQPQSQDQWRQSHPPQSQLQQQPNTYASWENPNTSTTTTNNNQVEQDPWSNQPSQNRFQSHGASDDVYQPPSGPPPSQFHREQQSNQPYYSSPPVSSDRTFDGGAGDEGPRPALPPRRTDTETARLLASQPDSGEQLEHMQHYEQSKPQTEDERNQSALQKQFPGIDGSLIAAIYNDHKEGSGGRVDLGSVREMLQELQS